MLKKTTIVLAALAVAATLSACGQSDAPVMVYIPPNHNVMDINCPYTPDPTPCDYAPPYYLPR